MDATYINGPGIFREIGQIQKTEQNGEKKLNSLSQNAKIGGKRSKKYLGFPRSRRCPFQSPCDFLFKPTQGLLLSQFMLVVCWINLVIENASGNQRRIH